MVLTRTGHTVIAKSQPTLHKLSQFTMITLSVRNPWNLRAARVMKITDIFGSTDSMAKTNFTITSATTLTHSVIAESAGVSGKKAAQAAKLSRI